VEPDVRKRFDKVDIRLSEHDENLIAHDKSLRGIRTLLKTGMQLLVKIESNAAETERKINALIDSDARLYDSLQQLAQAQKRTEESLKRFLDRSGNGQS
jgi:C4-dicarboxylate-specific signal transduction histidine kinase